MKKTTTVILSLAVLLFAACNKSGGYKKTKSGLLYKIVSDKKGALAKRGDFLKVHFVQKIRDSILGSTYGSMPTYVPVDSVGPDYNPGEIFPLLHKGDSVVVVMEADTLLRKQGQLPPFIGKKDKIILAFRVLEILNGQEAVQKDQIVEMEKQKQRDELRKVDEMKAIEQYLAKNNITAQKTRNGVYYEIQQPGTGPQADSGKLVAIKYTGYTFDGKYFDSNIDSTKQIQKHSMDPFQFISGVQGAIQGMLEGIQQFKKGGKGRLFIPSVLAYGARGMGEDIKPNTNLIFDIEVVDVTDAPQQPQMPQIPPQHQPH